MTKLTDAEREFLVALLDQAEVEDGMNPDGSGYMSPINILLPTPILDRMKQATERLHISRAALARRALNLYLDALDTMEEKNQ
jgi:hypothetical protein